ncbi:trypsin-like serine protease [Streptomyces himalayensis]|uniref:trypsin-like serine protease n=1 Tax=Streptomyces himalayensis TaxID=2820085 RepID=UPI0028A92E8E|nr:trypsin-like serine protease [Streptomyces himalayensis]
MTSLRSSAGAALVAAVATAGALFAVPAHAVAGDPVSAGSYAFTAKVSLGADDTARACSGALVASDWILTAASCFAADPEVPTVAAGKPALSATATVAGKTSAVVQLVPRAGRDLVLARLARPVTGVTPVTVASTAVTTGEQLRAVGYGRTATDWVPDTPHTTAFSVDAIGTDDLTVTGLDGALCQGDTGGPLLRETSGTAELVGVGSRSWQGGCMGETETRTGAVAARSDDLSAWVSGTVGPAPVTDFNCDGVEDIAVSDPGATVGGDAGAGLVRVVYGGGKGTAEINQDLDWVSGGSEAGDWFGEAIATVDYDEDGCTDLVVGTPAEDLSTATDAGMVDVLHGATGGLGTGTKKDTHFEQGSGTGSLAASVSESGDRLGHALAAGTTAAGEPFVVIGVPGEALGSITKAGSAIYLHGSTNIAVNQEATGVGGAAEAGDGFGTSVTGDANNIAIGAPGDAIGSDADAGNLAVFSHTLNSENRPTPLFGLDQDLDTVSGGAEAGDLFGQSLALVPYRPSGAAAATESILAIGAPGEALSVDGVAKAEAGLVLTFRITATGTYSQLQGYDSGTGDDDVSGTSEAGDHFGQTLAAVNTAPRAVSTTDTLKLAVGIPDEAIGTTASAGAVSTFSLLGTPGANDRWLEVGDGDGIPGTPGASQYLGRSIHYTGTSLYVGMAYGPSTYGALYALPLSNVTAGGTVAAATTYQPGTGGLPAAGTRFGYAAR